MRTIIRVAAGILVGVLGVLLLPLARANGPDEFTPQERAGMLKAARAIESGSLVYDALDGYSLAGLVAAADRIGDARLVDAAEGASELTRSAAPGVGPTILAGLALAKAMRSGADADAIQLEVAAWRKEWSKWPGRPK